MMNMLMICTPLYLYASKSIHSICLYTPIHLFASKSIHPQCEYAPYICMPAYICMSPYVCMPSYVHTIPDMSVSTPHICLSCITVSSHIINQHHCWSHAVSFIIFCNSTQCPYIPDVIYYRKAS